LGSNNAQPGGPSTSGATRVVRLEDRSRGAVVHLVGVSHVLAADAARDVRALLSHHRPDAVVLELCAERAGAAIAAALASSRGTGAGSRREDDANDAGPAGPRPPGVVPNAVSIRGLPVDRPLPGASPDDLLAQLRCQPGRLAAPTDIDADVRTLMESGLFEEVLVHVSAGESKASDDMSGEGEDDGNENVAGSNPEEDQKNKSRVLYCAGGACGDGVAEVIVGASVEFRCALDSSLAVTADVRFAWSEKAAKKLGGDPKDLEADVLRRAALLLLEYDKGRPGGRDDEDGDEKSAPGGGDADGDGDGDGDADADEETREGAALRAVLRESARRVCAARGLGAHKASVTVAGSPPESVWATASAPNDADDSGGRGFARASLADAGGAVWVSVETTSERETRERLDAWAASAGSGDRSRRGANGERARVPPGDRRGPPTLLRRIASVASAVAAEGTAPRAARAYFAASEIAQEMLAWRVLSATRKAPEGGTPGEEEGTPRVGEEGNPGGEEGTPGGEEGTPRVEDSVVRGAGDEAVAALALALEAGVQRVVLGDARASTTTAAIADAIRRRPGWFPGARLAASTVAAAARLVAFSSPDELRETISSGLNGGLNGGGGSNGTLADVAVADWLRDAVVDARDDRMFDAIRDAAGYERGPNASDGPPPAAFTRSTETPPGLGEGCACYRYDAECEDSVAPFSRSTGGSGRVGTTVVAVVGGAHVDGIVRRWNASTNEPGE